uniref:CRAL-TRIO domain-containing protein n=1 Tax=Haptolina brevifila TaxID=156173 RepID=A0A7S2GBX2_9EUKA|mmetsp:Transcript_31902/g.63689  ORF Transcript_31902/g.63689 Transcript_31902/m.63689 type:complete len:421 (+) Transcript_31902:23-1285(+)
MECAETAAAIPAYQSACAQPWAAVLTVIFAAAFAVMTYKYRQLHLQQQKLAARRKDASTQTQLLQRDPEVGRAVDLLRDLLLKHGLSRSQLPQDAELQRHLEAAKPPLSTPIACQRILATEHWRASRAAHPQTLAGFPKRVMVRGHDLLGRPCLRVRVREPFGTFAEEVLQCLEQHFESIGDEVAPEQQQVCILLDLHDVHLLDVTSPLLSAGYELVRTLRAHFPQRAALVHIVHMTSLASWIIGAANAILDSRTARKLVVHHESGTALAAALALHFDSSELPQEYGGTDHASPTLIPGENLTEGGTLNGANGGTNKEANSDAKGGSIGGSTGGSTGVASELARNHKQAASSGGGEVARGSSSMRRQARYVYSIMTKEEKARVDRLRAAADSDVELNALASFDAAALIADELLRFLMCAD